MDKRKAIVQNSDNKRLIELCRMTYNTLFTCEPLSDRWERCMEMLNYIETEMLNRMK